jgi:alkanesulfonate monooxygenase SsuD/methylene tetrahydromethanopterin reductase-like flavin-dependent oxidoreductase (luciferase family)
VPQHAAGNHPGQLAGQFFVKQGFFVHGPPIQIACWITGTVLKQSNCIDHNLTLLRLYHRIPAAYTAPMIYAERTMKIDLGSGELCLRHGQPLRLARAAGVRVDCLAGQIWITVTGEPADHFLQPGQSYRISDQGLALIESIGEGRVRLEMAQRENGGWFDRLLRQKPLAGGMVLSRTDQAASVPDFPA